MINVAQCRLVLLLFKGAVEYFQLCDGKDEGFVWGKSNNFRVVLARPMTSLHSRRLEVVGERESGRAQGRHACLLLARTLFLVPTTSKRLLRRLPKISIKTCSSWQRKIGSYNWQIMVKILDFNCVRNFCQTYCVYVFFDLHFVWIFTRNMFSINHYVVVAQYFCQ